MNLDTEILQKCGGPGMKYRVLTFDGQYIGRISAEELQFRREPYLLPHGTTIEMLIKNNPEQAKMLRKCVLEEVELRFTKAV